MPFVPPVMNTCLPLKSYGLSPSAEGPAPIIPTTVPTKSSSRSWHHACPVGGRNVSSRNEAIIMNEHVRPKTRLTSLMRFTHLFAGCSNLLQCRHIWRHPSLRTLPKSLKCCIVVTQLPNEEHLALRPAFRVSRVRKKRPLKGTSRSVIQIQLTYGQPLSAMYLLDYSAARLRMRTAFYQPFLPMHYLEWSKTLLFYPQLPSLVAKEGQMIIIQSLVQRWREEVKFLSVTCS